MQLFTNLLAIATLAQAAVAQTTTSTTFNSSSSLSSSSSAMRSILPTPTTLQSLDGYTTTRIFAPFNFPLQRGAQIFPFGYDGPNNETTMFGIRFQDGLQTPTLTLGPNTALITKTEVGGITVSGAAYETTYVTANCSYSLMTAGASNTATVTGKCSTMTGLIRTVSSSREATANFMTNNYPRPTSETTVVSGVYDGDYPVTAWDGMIDVYLGALADGRISTGFEVDTTTQEAGMPQVTAMVQAVVVIAAGAAAMAV